MSMARTLGFNCGEYKADLRCRPEHCIRRQTANFRAGVAVYS